MSLISVWVTSISNEYGIDTTVHSSEHEALARAGDYCREWWADVAEDDDSEEEPPTDDRECVETYTNRHDHEIVAVSEHSIDTAQCTEARLDA